MIRRPTIGSDLGRQRGRATQLERRLTVAQSTLRPAAEAVAAAARFATVVVAASDSSPAGQAAADFVCTGSNDQDTIMEAFYFGTGFDDFLGPEGGTLVLLEGHYNIEAPILVGSSSWGGTGFYGGVTILGLSAGTRRTVGTVLQTPNSDLAPGPLLALGDCNDFRVSGLTFIDRSASSNLQRTLLYVEGGDEITVDACTFYGFYLGIDAAGDEILVAENTLNGCGIWVHNGTRQAVEGNYLTSNYVNPEQDRPAIWVSGFFDGRVVGNVVDIWPIDGMWISAISDSLIAANTVRRYSNRTHNTYDGISCFNSMVSCEVVDNLCRKSTSGNGGRYGLSIDSGSYYNYVHGNDLYLSGVTGSFDDNGVGTVTNPAGGNKP